MSENTLNIKAREALRHIRNWVMQHGKVPSTRELMNVMGYKSPRSTLLLMEELLEAGFLAKKEDGSLRIIKDLESKGSAQTVPVPLVGTVACGTPLLAEENVEAMIPISSNLTHLGAKYFLLRAQGDSMDRAGINNNDLVLVKQQLTANNGDRIVALIDDNATVKEFHHLGEYIMLLPRSNNPKHKQIILTDDFRIQGIVVAVIPQLNI